MGNLIIFNSHQKEINESVNISDNEVNTSKLIKKRVSPSKNSLKI